MQICVGIEDKYILKMLKIFVQIILLYVETIKIHVPMVGQMVVIPEAAILQDIMDLEDVLVVEVVDVESLGVVADVALVDHY